MTGTNGKTTTTALITHLLNAAGIAARSVGNYGPPAVEAAIGAPDGEVLVAEVSSFQLENVETFHPAVAVLLNITPDHVDWHGSLEAYAGRQGPRVRQPRPGRHGRHRRRRPRLGADGGVGGRPRQSMWSASAATRSLAGGANAAHGELVLETRGGAVRLIPADALQIRGTHNVSNALAAAAAAHALGATPQALRDGLESFEPMEHRLEPAGVVAGASWYNDSKATNPDAVLKALTAFSDSPLIVLLGGRNKHNDFGPLAVAVSGTAKAAVLFGESRHELAAAFAGLPVRTVEAVSLSDACEAAAALAEPGDAVVLSPACASFDEFTSYEERGQVFKRLVRTMAGEVG